MKTLWQFLDNKKSAISATINILLLWAINRGYVSGDVADVLISLFTVWTGVAVADKIRREVSIKQGAEVK